MIRSVARFARDEDGASTIELALVAPFLASLIIGIIDISRGYSEKLQLEQVAQRSVEKAMQGMQGDNSTEIFNSLQAEAATAAGVPESNVDVTYWLECNGVRQNTSRATMAADYNDVCSGGEYYARYLNVRIQKTYTPMFKIKWLGSNTNGTFTLIGEAGLRVQ